MVMKIKVEIPDRSITRAKLEYPTEDVNLAYLMAIGKATYVRTSVNWAGHATIDNFADKAIEAYAHDNDGGPVSGMLERVIDGGNAYLTSCVSSAATRDFIQDKVVAASISAVAWEAVDLPAYRSYFIRLSISGSTHKGFREDMTIPKFTATDTSIASGRWGSGNGWARGNSFRDARFRAPSSPAPPALTVLELEVEGSGAQEDPYRPLLNKNLVEIAQLTGLPDFLYREAKKYEILKARGFTEEEMRQLLGYIPQHQVDLSSVTWGAFEFNKDSPTNIIVITGDNPYQQGAIAIQKHIELARSKNLKTLRQPRNYGEATAQYNQLKRDYPHWLAGKDNYVYQVLGLEELDLFQNIDFYHGELIEHKTHYQQLKQTPEWELWRRLEVLEEKLNKVTVLTEERDKHISKLKEVKRLGW
jgi:hypothetical protein